jgi:hypothetical protein
MKLFLELFLQVTLAIENSSTTYGYEKFIHILSRTVLAKHLANFCFVKLKVQIWQPRHLNQNNVCYVMRLCCERNCFCKETPWGSKYREMDENDCRS